MGGTGSLLCRNPVALLAESLTAKSAQSNQFRHVELANTPMEGASSQSLLDAALVPSSMAKNVSLRNVQAALQARYSAARDAFPVLLRPVSSARPFLEITAYHSSAQSVLKAQHLSANTANSLISLSASPEPTATRTTARLLFPQNAPLEVPSTA